jgi:hypothetical protein
MDKQIILREILNNKKLKEKYWPEIEPEKENLATVLHSKNKYIKSLHSLLNTDNPNVRTSEIFNFFKL